MVKFHGTYSADVFASRELKRIDSTSCSDHHNGGFVLPFSQDEPQHPISQPTLAVATAVASPVDVVRLKRFRRYSLLQQPELEVLGYSLPGVCQLVSQRFHTDSATLIVGSTGRHLVGFVDFRPEMVDFRWHCVAIGDGTGSHDPVPILSELILEGIREAGIHGVKRIYAKAPTDSDLVESFRAAGFAPFAQEVVFVAESPATLSGGSSLRQQGRSDTWSIHQLYNASVPEAVLHAEAYTSHRWDLPVKNRVGSAVVHGWLSGDGPEPDVYVRTLSKSGKHLLDIIYRPDRFDRVGSVIDGALFHLQRQRAAKRVFVPVRTYALEMQNELLNRGFRPWLDQTLLMRYTAVQVRATLTENSLSDQESRKGLPRRVPAYLTVDQPSRHPHIDD